MKKLHVIKLLGMVVIGCLAIFSVVALAAGEATKDIGQIATQITGTFKSLGQLMAAVAYLAGFGLTIAAIFKFKQHKDNPQQFPLGTAIALLFVGIALIFLPTIVNIGGTTIFGTEGKAGGFTGTGATNLPGAEK
jgi:intracellular multiplication protein IcmD